MASTYTTNKNIEVPASGDYVNTWATPVNADWSAIDAAFGGTTYINPTGASGTVTLTATQYRPPNIVIQSGALAGNVNYQLPSGVGGLWSIANNATGYTVTISSAGGGSSVTLGAAGSRYFYMSDGTNVFKPEVDANGAAGADTQVQYNSSGNLTGSANMTFSAGNLTVGGSVVTAYFTGSTDATGTILTVSGVTGTLAAGQRIFAPGIPLGTSTISGSGPTTYTLSPAVSSLSAQPMFAASTGIGVNGSTVGGYGYFARFGASQAAINGQTVILGTGTTSAMDAVPLGQTTPAAGKFTQAVTPVSAIGNSGTAFTLNCALSNVFTLVMTGNVASGGWTISNPSDGQTVNLFITQGSGPFTLAWPTSFKFPSGSAGVAISTTSGYVDLLVMTYRSSTGFWYCTLLKNFT